MMYIFHYLVACILIQLKLTCAYALASSDVVEFDEYIVEHEISSTQAKNSALSTDIDSLHIPPGCQPCTRSEKYYCLGSEFINDHCCCDKRYHEVLPFVPHTCYLGVTLCQPVAQDCTEYKRLRMCCCNKYVLAKWKQISSASPRFQLRTTCYVLILMYIVNRYL